VKVKHITLSNSSYDEWKKCPYSFYKTYLTAPRTSEEQPNKPALAKGSYLHAKLAPLYGCPVPQSIPSLSRDDQEHLDEVLALYMQYVYPDDIDWKPLLVEEKLTIQINDQFSYMGTPDLVQINGDKVRLVDHKSTSSLSRYLMGVADNNNQLTGYAFLLLKSGKLTVPIDQLSFMHNGIATSKTALDKTLRTGNPFASELFMRYETHRTQEHIDIFLRDLTRDVARIVDDIETKLFRSDKSPKSCGAYFSTCKYSSECFRRPGSVEPYHVVQTPHFSIVLA
jgi:hypothetical protein